MRRLLLGPSLALLLLCVATSVPAADAHTDVQIRLWSGIHEGLGRLVYTIDLDTTPGPAATHRIYQSVSIGRPQFLFSDLQFFNGVRRSDVLFTFSDDGRRVYHGATTTGDAAFFFEPIGDGVRVYQGSNNQGQLLYTFLDNGRIYQGSGPQGSIVLSTTPDVLSQTAPVVQAITILLQLTPTY
jgi:hypothetical protein